MLKVLKRISKNGNPYFALVYDLGYKVITLTLDRYSIIEICGLSPQSLNNYFLSGNEEYIIKEV